MIRRARQITLNAALATLALSALFGAPSTVAAQDRETVRLWHAYAGAEEEALKEIAERFEATHPDVDVELLAVAFGAYAAKLEAAIPTGRGPDVFIDAHERLTSYRESGLVRAIPAANNAELFPATHLAALSAEGTLYGLPLSVKCAALYYHPSLLSSPPSSLEALVEMSLPEGTTPLVFEAENAYYVAALLHADGGAMIDEAGDYGFVGDAAERTLTTLTEWTTRGAIPEEASGELVKRLFASGDAAAAISGPWLAPDLSGDDWAVVPLPPFREGGLESEPYATVEAIFFPANARSEARGQELARFIATGAGAMIRARTARQVVSARDAVLDPGLAADDFLATFRDAGERARPMPTHANMRYTFEPATRALRAALRGGFAPRDALASGARFFSDVTRPLPERRDPMFALVLIGLFLFGLVVLLARTARDPVRRAAIRDSLPAYKYMAHAFVAVGGLVILPLAVGAAVSFFSGRGRDLYFVGFANYVEILTARGGDLLGSGSFWLVLLVTALWTLANLTLHLVIGVALALLLNRPSQALKGPYRVLLILPWAVPSYVTALAWKGMFHRQFGAVNEILIALGAEPVSWFAKWSTAFSANVATNVWLGFPFMMVVTLGALSAIPKELYQAAAVDGATPWQQFRHVTAPLLIPSLAPAVAMGAVWTFNMFNVVFLVSGGEPGGGTEILVSEAYRWAFTRSSQYGYAAAYAVLIFFVLLLATRPFAKKLEAM